MPVDPGSPAEYASWFVALTGLWIAASAVLYGASGATFNNNVVAGLLVAVAAAFVGYRIRTE
jgi:hypothetical protein